MTLRITALFPHPLTVSRVGSQSGAGVPAHPFYPAWMKLEEKGSLRGNPEVEMVVKGQ